jgi:hypothetical protein
MLGNLYSGTLKRFATSLSRISQMSPQVRSNVAYKTSKNPLGKGWEAYPTAFSMQRLGYPSFKCSAKRPLL